MDGSTSTPRAWLRRLDFALAAPARPAPAHNNCHDCEGALEETTSAALAWCDPCRRVYIHAAGRLLCEVPDHWRQERLFEFLERAMEGRCNVDQDMAFTRFLCERATAGFESVLGESIGRTPDQVRIGRLALSHRLLSRGEVAWVLRYQRSARAHRRRCFGEVASALGFWRPCIAARLLAVQAERRRGVARAAAERLGISRERFLEAERAFFGLAANRSNINAEAPFDALMAA